MPIFHYKAVNLCVSNIQNSSTHRSLARAQNQCAVSMLSTTLHRLCCAKAQQNLAPLLLVNFYFDSFLPMPDLYLLVFIFLSSLIFSNQKLHPSLSSQLLCGLCVLAFHRHTRTLRADIFGQPYSPITQLSGKMSYLRLLGQKVRNMHAPTHGCTHARSQDRKNAHTYCS